MQIHPRHRRCACQGLYLCLSLVLPRTATPCVVMPPDSAWTSTHFSGSKGPILACFDIWWASMDFRSGACSDQDQGWRVLVGLNLIREPTRSSCKQALFTACSSTAMHTKLLITSSLHKC